jgi:hypothetical protein
MIDGVTVVGPFESPGVSRPATAHLHLPAREGASAEQSLRAPSWNLARRAFRRPASSDDDDSLMRYFEAGQEGTGGLMRASNKRLLPCWSAPIFCIGRFERPKTTK